MPIKLGEPPLGADPIELDFDREGRPLGNRFTADWEVSLVDLFEIVRGINEVRQRTIIGSWDEVKQGERIAANWPTANLAFYVPFTVYEQIEIQRVLVAASGASVAGNVQVAVYELDGTRKAVTAAITHAASQVLTGALNVVLDPRRYYMGMSFSSASDGVLTVASLTGTTDYNSIFGIKEEASAYPLPATATMSDSLTRKFLPVFALSAES